MPLVLGGVALVLFALLSLSASTRAEGKKRSENTVLGALAVAAVVFVLAKAGLGWLGIGLVLLWQTAKRFSGDARAARARARARRRSPEVTSAGSAPMSREEAYEVLGLTTSATPEDVLAAYRRLMKKVHPDLGGTTYLAMRLNQAKDVLLS